MTPPLTLIQLISEQTMQNLLPVMALKPERVIHLTTSKTAARSARIVEAARQAGLTVSAENIRLTEMPTIPETSRAVLRAIEAVQQPGGTAIVNFTGGTKLMSIGAYEAALGKKVPSIYVDTQSEAFIDGHTGAKINELLGDDLSFTSFQQRLTVNSVAVANGRDRVTAGKDWRPYLELARHLFEFPTEETAAWEAIHGREGLCPNGREPRKPGDWIALLNRPVRLPPVVAELAASAAILERRNSAFYLPAKTENELLELAQMERPSSALYFSAVRDLQFSLAFLSGAWWEIVIADAADRSGQFRDLRWSVNVGNNSGGFDPEEDIVGLDGVQVAYYSCKRGGARARLVPILDELDNRARSIGGNFTRRFLAIATTPAPRLLDEIKRRARELNGIRILTPADLQDPEIFKRR